MRHNRKRYDYDYRVNDIIMIKTYYPTKMQEKLHEPYPIAKTQTNGTVILSMDPNNFIQETFNLRKIVPIKGN